MEARFTERERRALVSEWRRSGLSAKAFSEGRGFHPLTLCRWARAEQQGEQGLRLVEVVADPPREPDSQQWAWELKGPGGELRGQSLDAHLLRVLVAGVVEGRR